MPAPQRDPARSAASSEVDASTRERILEVALRSFAERGFDGSSTRAIASEAGVNQGLIPYYFGTKDALWREAVSGAFAKLREGVGDFAVLEDVSERERLALLIRRYVRFVAENPEFVMLMHEEGKRDGERMRWLVDTHVRPVYEAMSRVYARAQQEGEMADPFGSPHFHYLFAGAVGVIFHQAPECRRLFGVDPMDPKVVEDHADALVQLFLGDAALGRGAAEPAR